MSSPFSLVGARAIPVWTDSLAPDKPTTFVPFNPFGTFIVDSGYGSGGYGDLPYGQGVLGEVTFTTVWTGYTLK